LPERSQPDLLDSKRESRSSRELRGPPVVVPAFSDRLAELGLDAQQHGLDHPVDGRYRLEGENEPPSEQSSAHDELVGIVGVALVANMIEAREGARLLVQVEVALGRGKQSPDLAPLS
jgi:hypothetical protein